MMQQVCPANPHPPSPALVQADQARHAVARLRNARLVHHSQPYLLRGKASAERCGGCRLFLAYCICKLRPHSDCQAGVCLLMAEAESLKPSNTGWLIADIVADTFAFEWARTVTAPGLLELLAEPHWQPYVVFPGEFVAPERVVNQLPTTLASGATATSIQKRPLFILLDGTWSEARKIFKKSPYLSHLPVLSLSPEQVSRYRLRRSKRDDHLCTAEVAALCLQQAGDNAAAEALDAWLDLFMEHYARARQQQKVDWQDPIHQRIASLTAIA